MSVASNVDLRSMRVDLVGSLLRSQTLKDAFANYGEGSAREVDLKDAQDEAIRDVVAKQVAHNLPIIVDGEFRQLHGKLRRGRRGGGVAGGR
jgi:5-methyltetrahydropteroyltriglutamate--homocysteine methyltransferase